LEYDLAFGGLAEEVYVAAKLAAHDDAINSGKKELAKVAEDAKVEFRELQESANGDPAKLCTKVYELFHSREASKAIAAQHLATNLAAQGEKPGFDRRAFADKLPRYVVEAIAYATGAKAQALPSPSVAAGAEPNG
jgi:putative ATP-dependent endonuclease of OLD family